MVLPEANQGAKQAKRIQRHTGLSDRGTGFVLSLTHLYVCYCYFILRCLGCECLMQVEWTPYGNDPRALLNAHPRTTFIGGITCFDIIEVYLPERIVRQVCFVQAIPPSPMRPTHALRPAHRTYPMTFASPPIYTEAWSRFPFCGRIGNQALRRASVPSEANPSYID